VRVVSEGILYFIKSFMELLTFCIVSEIKGSMVPSSALPLGMEATLSSDMKFKKIEPGDLLLHSVLAVSSAMPPSESGKLWTAEEETQALITSPIAGFIYW
jgi:polyribonucleotide 5'-hydroxyl-kinase